MATNWAQYPTLKFPAATTGVHQAVPMRGPWAQYPRINFNQVTTGATKAKAKAKAKKPDAFNRFINRFTASLLTPAQQAAQTKAAVNAQIQQGLADLKAQAATERTSVLQQQARARQFALALGSLRDIDQAQAGVLYTNAARDIQGLGTGLTGAVAEAQQRVADEDAARIAAATEGLGKAAPLDVAGMRNVAQYTGVTLPSETLYGQAASQAALAKLRTDMGAQQIANIATDYDQKLQTIADELKREQGKLTSKRPSLYTEALQSVQGGQRQDVATLISALALQNALAKTPSEIAKTKAETAATKAGTQVTQGKTIAQANWDKGLLRDGSDVRDGYYFAGKGKTNPSPIPEGKMWDPRDPTHHSLANIPVTPTTRPGGKAPQYTPQQLANWEKGLLHDGSDVRAGFYFGGPGRTNPTTIPNNFHIDPRDHTKIIRDTKPPPAGESKAAKTARLDGLVKDFTTRLDDDSIISSYSRDTRDAVDIELGEPPQWRPLMTYAQARAKLLASVSKEIRADSRVLSLIDTFLTSHGYRKAK